MSRQDAFAKAGRDAVQQNIQGTLDFSLIGILAKISNILAENKIGIFAISTYNTDYILTRQAQFQQALQVLQQAGYQIKPI